MGREVDAELDISEVLAGDSSTSAQAIIRAVNALGQTELFNVGAAEGQDVELLTIAAGRQLVSVKQYLDEYRKAPERKKGTATLKDPVSFVEHVNRMKDADTVLFACLDRSNPSITAVYDYHRKDGSPRFGQHRSHYPFPLSDEWRAWLGHNGRQLTQQQFAEFIEDRVMDLAPPTVAGPRTQEYVRAIECELATTAQVATLSRELEVRVAQRFVQQTKLGSGESQMVFKEEHKDENGASLKVPGAFLIQIPIFFGGLLAVLPVRLRYRVDADHQSVRWFYNLALVDELFASAINDEIERIQKAVERPIYFGSPEQ